MGKLADSLKRDSHSDLTSDRLFKRTTERIDHLLIDVAKELEREMDRGRRCPGDARASLQPLLKATLQFLLDRGKFVF